MTPLPGALCAGKHHHHQHHRKHIMAKYDWDPPKFAEHAVVQTPRRPYDAAALAAVQDELAKRQRDVLCRIEPTHRPSGRMCAECVHALEPCGHLLFHTMQPIGKPDADGTRRVRCARYTKAAAR